MAPPRRLFVRAGDAFGALTVVGEIEGSQPRVAACSCSCGVPVTVPIKDLHSGHTISCGCAKAGRLAALNRSGHHPRSTHGLSNNAHYDRWCGMMSRCHNPASNEWDNYGGRGITVCDEWHDVTRFIEYLSNVLGPCPPGHSIDRIDNNSGYRPGNVRWADRSTQNKNRRPWKRRNHDRTIY